MQPRDAKGVVAASRRSDRQFQLAYAGSTVDSKAADKLFSSTMSTPASSVNPNCLDSQDTRQQGAKAVTHHARSLVVARQSRKLHSTILYSSLGLASALSIPAVSNVCCFCLVAISLCSIPAMYTDNSGLLQIHIQHLHWHSDRSCRKDFKVSLDQACPMLTKFSSSRLSRLWHSLVSLSNTLAELVSHCFS